MKYRKWWRWRNNSGNRKGREDAVLLATFLWTTLKGTRMEMTYAQDPVSRVVKFSSFQDYHSSVLAVIRDRYMSCRHTMQQMQLSCSAHFVFAVQEWVISLSVVDTKSTWWKRRSFQYFRLSLSDFMSYLLNSSYKTDFSGQQFRLI